MSLRSLISVLFGVSMVGSCWLSPDNAGDVVTVPALPAEVAGWIAAGENEVYDTESIFAYIDGHAEVYLAYGMKRCVSRRFVTSEGGDEIVVDLFEMASPADAFGVFSHDRDGETVAVGRGGVFRHGWLSFWQASWYGSVYASGADEGSRDATVAVAEAVARALPPGGEVPALVGRLPTDGLVPQSVCFLRSPQILNAHVFVGGDNLFELGPEVEAVVGKYVLDGTAVHLALVRYPSEAAAAAVEARLRQTEAPAEGRPAMIVGRRLDSVAAVIGPEQGEAGEVLLEQALGGAA